MAKRQMPKIRRAICNIAVDVQDICNSLPRNSQEINRENLPPELCDLDEYEEIVKGLTNESDIEWHEENLKRLDNFRQAPSESSIFPAVLTSEYIETAPREDKIPRSAILDKDCKELVIQLNVKQNYHLTNSLIKDYFIIRRYFHHWWIIYFFVQFVLQKVKKLFKTCKEKLFSSNVTARMPSKNFKKTIQTLVTSD